MELRPDFLVALIAMGFASFFCRAGGFFLMRYVTVTPRVEAGLKAIPLSVMVGIVAPVAAKGQPAELAALVVVGVVMKATGNDLIAAVAGVAVIALTRAFL